MTTHISKEDTLILDAVPLNGREVQLSEEHTAYRWIRATEVDTTNATPETKDLLRSWFSSRG